VRSLNKEKPQGKQYMTKYAYPATGYNSGLLAKLEKLYGARSIGRDVLGRRAAMPSEIQQAITGRERGGRIGKHRGR
jgi:hypothetical protein